VLANWKDEIVSVVVYCLGVQQPLFLILFEGFYEFEVSWQVVGVVAA
jgi:hypothetical protein